MSWWIGVSREDWPAVLASQQERIQALDISMTAISMHRPTRAQKRRKAELEEEL